jgi:hypothetical protein
MNLLELERAEEKEDNQIMNNDNRDNGAYSISLILAGIEPVESIEELLRQRGFFDSTESDEKG